jgi:hypothetical protein
MSADGRIICAVPSGSPYISTNSGNTWTRITNSPLGPAFLGGVAIAADGTKIFTPLISNTIPRTWIFLSPDHGATWTPTGFPSTKSTNYYVACSADGSKVIAALANGPIFYSTNGGVNCYTSSVPNATWNALASSADGRRMVAAANGGAIYFSGDCGTSWTPGNLPAQFWNSVCASANGKWVGATGNQSYISSDAGGTWRTNHIAGQTIACSANGTNWLIVGGQIYTSTNSGADWQTNLASAQWNAGAISADGSEIIVVGTAQGTWLGSETPSPQLNIQPQASAVILSWLIPSTNFVLQQNSDLATTNWTTISNNPTLNFTNLNQELNLPISTSNTFFRLMAQ